MSGGGKRGIDVGPGGDDPKKAKGEVALAFDAFLQNNDVWRSTLLPLLDPIDLIRLMHVSRASRRAAARALNALEAGATHQTAGHREMFRAFLRNPRVAQPNRYRGNRDLGMMKPKVLDEWHCTAGPLRLDAIEAYASNIEKRFAILSYEKTYDQERSLVALFDEHGAFADHYVFSSEQFYEDYTTGSILKRGMWTYGSDMARPNITLLSSGRKWGAADDRKWAEPTRAQTEYNEEEDYWWGDVLEPHVALIDTFAGTLSPTEAMYTLMHALSSDTRVIYVMVTSFFDRLGQDFRLEDEDDEVFWREEFQRKLSQFSYPFLEESGDEDTDGSTAGVDGSIA